MGGFGHL